MSKITNPQEKKRLSLALDRRNSYGENDKSSRKGIAVSKARQHRAERRVASVLLAPGSIPSEENAQVLDATVKAKTRVKQLQGFVKYPDRPLSVDIARKLARRQRIDER